MPRSALCLLQEYIGAFKMIVLCTHLHIRWPYSCPALLQCHKPFTAAQGCRGSSSLSRSRRGTESVLVQIARTRVSCK